MSRVGNVIFDISMSLDGYVAGPNQNPDQGLGEGGEQLHEWAVDLATFHERHGRSGGETGPDDEILAEMFDRAGATVMGKRMFGGGEGPWGDDPWQGWWGDDPPFHNPVFVLTHHPREKLEMQGGTSFTFVTEGIEAAVEQAKDAAGEKDVLIGGGAETIRQALEAGLVDEGQIHLVPVLLGSGTSLLAGIDPQRVELEKVAVVDSTGVTHLRYRVIR